MSGHPQHGTKPLERKLMVKAVPMSGGAKKFLWKLCASDNPKRIHAKDGSVTLFVGTDEEARKWASRYPGWDLTHA